MPTLWTWRPRGRGVAEPSPLAPLSGMLGPSRRCFSDPGLAVAWRNATKMSPPATAAGILRAITGLDRV